MTDATIKPDLPAAGGNIVNAGTSTAVSKIVMQALLLIGNDHSKALACLSQAQQMIESEPAMADARGRADRAASAPPAALPSRAVPPVAKGGLAPWQISKIRRYIDENIDESITLLKLADLTRLSVSYFSAAFKVSFGVSPHAYIIAQRVERAKRHIALTDAPLSEIALDCGLADQAHLSRIFRRHTGFTPSSWRRAHAGASFSRSS